jgi:hypothetical protein
MVALSTRGCHLSGLQFPAPSREQEVDIAMGEVTGISRHLNRFTLKGKFEQQKQKTNKKLKKLMRRLESDWS